MNWRTPAGLAVASLLAVAAIGCMEASGSQTASQGYVAVSDEFEAQVSSDAALAQSAPARSPRLARLLDGFPLWMENGDSISVSSSLDAGVTLKPYPPAREGVLDLVLQNPADGAPIMGARVETTAHMRYMDHGVFRASGTERTGDLAAAGQYRVPLRLLMPGEWVVTVQVSTGTLAEEFELLVAVNQ